VTLPKVHRLRRRQDFSQVYKTGLRRHTPNLTLRALKHRPGQASEPTCVGISISLKVSKRAVVRNLIKRRIRAVLRQLLPQFSQGWRIVVVVQPSATECAYEQFLQELKQLLISAEVINGC
jgi:ribonuclease P protein component